MRSINPLPSWEKGKEYLSEFILEGYPKMLLLGASLLSVGLAVSLNTSIPLHTLTILGANLLCPVWAYAGLLLGYYGREPNVRPEARKLAVLLGVQAAGLIAGGGISARLDLILGGIGICVLTLVTALACRIMSRNDKKNERPECNMEPNRL